VADEEKVEGLSEGGEVVQEVVLAQAPEQAEVTFVLPTRMAVHRYQQMKVESILNTAWQVTGGKTPFEHCLLEDQEAGAVVSALGLQGEQAEIALDLLEDAKAGGEVDEVYGPRGGVLSILLPTTDPERDLVWQGIRKKLPGAPTIEGFSVMPNEMFSSLPPGHVWAGTGRIEMALAEGFLRYLWGELKDKKFASLGMANNEWLSRLRLWAYNPAPNYRGRIVDLIFHERRDLLRRRLELCEQLGLPCEFAPPEF
jgi:hypothetical protein